MGFRRNIGRVVLAAVIAAVGVFVAAEPAAAAGPACPYPYVCFYTGHYGESGSTINGKFQVVTSGYQAITASTRYSDSIVNTRHDDVAYVRFSDGKVVCLPHAVLSGGTWYATSYDTDNDFPQRYINGVRISSSPTC
jgi:hypothetical protein